MPTLDLTYKPKLDVKNKELSNRKIGIEISNTDPRTKNTLRNVIIASVAASVGGIAGYLAYSNYVNNRDVDGDGVKDVVEREWGTDPNKPNLNVYASKHGINDVTILEYLKRVDDTQQGRDLVKVINGTLKIYEGVRDRILKLVDEVTSDHRVTEDEVKKINDVDNDGFVQVKVNSGEITEREVGGRPFTYDGILRYGLERGLKPDERAWTLVKKVNETTDGVLTTEAQQAIEIVASLPKDARNYEGFVKIVESLFNDGVDASDVERLDAAKLAFALQKRVLDLGYDENAARLVVEQLLNYAMQNPEKMKGFVNELLNLEDYELKALVDRVIGKGESIATSDWDRDGKSNVTEAVDDKTNMFDPTNSFKKLNEAGVAYVDKLVAYNGDKLLPELYDTGLKGFLEVIQENPEIIEGLSNKQLHIGTLLTKFVPELIKKYPKDFRTAIEQVEIVIYGKGFDKVKGEEYVYAMVLKPHIEFLMKQRELGRIDKPDGEIDVLTFYLFRCDIKTGEWYGGDSPEQIAKMLEIAVKNVTPDESGKSPEEWLTDNFWNDLNDKESVIRPGQPGFPDVMKKYDFIINEAYLIGVGLKITWKKCAEQYKLNLDYIREKYGDKIVFLIGYPIYLTDSEKEGPNLPYVGISGQAIPYYTALLGLLVGEKTRPVGAIYPQGFHWHDEPAIWIDKEGRWFCFYGWITPDYKLVNPEIFRDAYKYSVKPKLEMYGTANERIQIDVEG
ncbi:MAG: hypothetical protein B6U95_07660 [Thermofilum sp. ex4484_82]|nr:MAG: hypothetical protein B6U95_07660 [Thermofilum sp. ex4484_82]OYT36997.1 MAG: hypothetical protein B6U96_07660 [Archaeoglobales archaeon ex4484_92]